MVDISLLIRKNSRISIICCNCFKVSTHSLLVRQSFYMTDTFNFKIFHVKLYRD